MLDVKLIRDNPDTVRKDLKRRHHPEYVDYLEDFIKSDKRWRELLAEASKLREKRNEVSLEIAKAKKEKKDTAKLMKEAENIPQKIKEIETEVRELEENNRLLLLKIPNIMHKDVPDGKDESENKEIG